MKSENLAEITALRHELHRHPELSGQEIETRRRIQAFIFSHTGKTPEDRGDWFYYYYPAAGTPKKPPIAFRADFDALPVMEDLPIPWCSENPGVSHKCGHDGHSSALAGVALELNSRSLERDVYLIFQPAEEIGAGGEKCAKLIAEKQISEVYAMHNWSGFPAGKILYRAGCCQCASMGLTLTFHGSPAHASLPEFGHNPASAIAELIRLGSEKAGVQHINAPAAPFTGMVLCTVVHVKIGEPNFGISAYEGSISVTLRAEFESELQTLNELLRSEAKRLADANGLTLEVSACDVFPETASDPDKVQRVLAAAEKCGLETYELKKPLCASEDFGWYLHECPGAIFYIGNGEDYSALHTAEYDFRDENLNSMVDMFLALI